MKPHIRSKPFFQRTLFIFRRDLRLEDNTGLLFALKHSKEVIASFIFTPQQVIDNPYRSDRSLQFMIESLEDLNRALLKKGGKLYLFFGSAEQIVLNCIEQLKIDAVVVNCDYTPFSTTRDAQIAVVCKRHNTAFFSFEDLLLHPLSHTLKADGKPYTIFTPFYKNACKLTVDLPEDNNYTHYYSNPIRFAREETFFDTVLPQRKKQQKGGREEALKILNTIATFCCYKLDRDFPSKKATTALSPHLKFNTCSIREAYHYIHHAFGSDADLIRSLYWRDFFTTIAAHFPFVFKGAFKSEFNQIEWDNSIDLFTSWCEGRTGFPLIDAGMRELNASGLMHNRVRMIAASFLVKDLHIDWRWGEKYFARHLLDYDPAVNNGNWQWCASTGCDAQPYFRIFNPWNQQTKFDPECVYIKHWIPELRQLSAKAIHNWHLDPSLAEKIGYPAPVIEHAVESKKTLNLYRIQS